MKICIPSRDHRGLSSEVFDHFGSAPWFTIVDTEDGKVRTVRNPNCHRDEGSCHHVDILRKAGVTAVVSSGIGRRAWEGLDAAGIRVFSASFSKVGELVEAVKSGGATLLDLSETCAEHGQGAWGGRGRGRGLGRGMGRAHRHGQTENRV